MIHSLAIWSIVLATFTFHPACETLFLLAFLTPCTLPLPLSPWPVPPAPAALQLHHPLHSSPSPLVRGLPQLELQFQHDLAVAKAYWGTSQLRVQR